MDEGENDYCIMWSLSSNIEFLCVKEVYERILVEVNYKCILCLIIG